MVNGPEGDSTDWQSIDWRGVEEEVRRLRQRIFTGLLEPDAVNAASGVLRGCGAAMRRTGTSFPPPAEAGGIHEGETR